MTLHTSSLLTIAAAARVIAAPLPFGQMRGHFRGEFSTHRARDERSPAQD